MLLVFLVAFLAVGGVYGIYYGLSSHSSDSNEESSASTSTVSQASNVEDKQFKSESNTSTIPNVELAQANIELPNERDSIELPNEKDISQPNTELSSKVLKKVETEQPPSIDKNGSNYFSSVKKFFNDMHENFSALE